MTDIEKKLMEKRAQKIAQEKDLVVQGTEKAKSERMASITKDLREAYLAQAWDSVLLICLNARTIPDLRPIDIQKLIWHQHQAEAELAK